MGSSRDTKSFSFLFYELGMVMMTDMRQYLSILDRSWDSNGRLRYGPEVKWWEGEKAEELRLEGHDEGEEAKAVQQKQQQTRPRRGREKQVAVVAQRQTPMESMPEESERGSGEGRKRKQILNVGNLCLLS
jgi:hypothetical protein